MQQKICHKCNKLQSLKNFYAHKTAKDGCRNICKKCTLIAQKERTSKPENRAFIQKYRKQYFQKNKELVMKKRKAYLSILENHERYKKSVRNADLKRNYGITLEDKIQMYHSQKGLCLVCKQSFKSMTAAHVDHNHKTKKVRALICSNCNTFLGLAKENIEILRSAINYLQSYE